MLGKKYVMISTSSIKNIKVNVNIVCFVEVAFTKMVSVVKCYFKICTKILFFGERLEKFCLKMCNV